jgi:flagellar protein FlgJ
MTPPSMTKADFIAAATAAAQESSALSGFPPGVTVAQAALESAWGRSQLATEANNYFGIKVHGGMPSVALPTTEIVGAAPVRVTARFARYASMADCFRDRDAILARLSLYAAARAASKDPEAFTRALARHWATDPEYAEKVLAIYRAHELFKLDRQGEQE